MINKLMSLKHFTAAWTVTALTTVIVASIASGAPHLVTAGSTCGILYVLGVAFGNKWANLFGAALAGIFGYLSYTQGFFVNAAINLAYSLPLSLYGLWLWNKNSSNGSINVKRSLSARGKALTSIATVVIILCSCAFSFHLGANLWYLDGLSAVLPVLGTWLLVNMYKEQWNYWITYNLLEVFMWFTVISSAPEMLSIFAMRVVFLINSIFGYISWNKD